MPDWIIVTLSALLGGLIGGGAFAGLFYRALKDRLIEDLSKIFARRSEVNDLGGKVTASVSMATMAKDRADANADSIIRLQSSEEHRWAPMAKALDRLSRRLDESEKRAERHTALLDEITRRMDRHDNHSR